MSNAGMKLIFDDYNNLRAALRKIMNVANYAHTELGEQIAKLAFEALVPGVDHEKFIKAFREDAP